MKKDHTRLFEFPLIVVYRPAPLQLAVVGIITHFRSPLVDFYDINKLKKNQLKIG